jgi:DNA-binding GntR family transcriptional regulator
LQFRVDVHSRQTAHQWVRENLRTAILTGEISGGTRLVQSELAASLQVSTTPIREALRDLAGEGLVTIDAHRGAIVRELSGSELDEIYHIRQMLEPEAVRLAVERITDREVDLAAEVQARADRETDYAKWVELNHEFHGVFMKAARAPRLTGIISNLQDSASAYIAASLMGGGHRLEDANRQHHRLLDAFRRRDVAEAQAATLEHIASTLDHARISLKGGGKDG